MEPDKSLEERQRSEIEFHDAKYTTGESFPKHYYSDPTTPIYKDMLESLGDLTGKRVLEYGCGDGWCTVDLCKTGAFVDAFDISPEATASAEVTLSNAGFEDMSEIRTLGAEKLDYPDASFDICFGFAILHHLDLELAIPEMKRVLKPGGIALFAEPLQGNPLLRLYRRLTPQFRTPDERPMMIREFPDVFDGFSDIRHKEYYLAGQAAMGLLYVPFISRAYPFAHKVCWSMDRAILKVLPSLGSWAWYSVIEARN